MSDGRIRGDVTTTPVRTAAPLPPNTAVDFHCHLLPGLDDGARTPEDSLAMARMLACSGYRQVCCTPHHLRGVWDTTSGQVREATARLQQLLDRANIGISLHAGMEYYLDEYLLEQLDDPLLLPGGLLLVELPTHAAPEFVRQICFRLTSAGHRLLIAHPERSPLLAPPDSQGFLGVLFGRSKVQQPSLLAYLRELGCAFQGNLGSRQGLYGQRVKKAAAQLKSMGLYDFWGSDAHNPEQLTRIFADKAIKG